MYVYLVYLKINKLLIMKFLTASLYLEAYIYSSFKAETI